MNRAHSRKSDGPISPTNHDSHTNSRTRQTKKDELIRKKAEDHLNKRQPTSSPQKPLPRKAGTVSSLKPTIALTVSGSYTVLEASQLMAAKRFDCVLVINQQDQLCGIFTSKDLAYRVVAEGLDPSLTLVKEIMTSSPMCVTSDASATQALSTMVEKGFRHLPVVDEQGDVYGLLDITKCLYDALEKMDRAYESSKKLYDAIQGVSQEWGQSRDAKEGYLRMLVRLKDSMACPTLRTLLTSDSHPAVIGPKTSVRDAARIMKENHVTAVLVMDGPSIAGIFTSKDVVLRVIAAGLSPVNCSVVRVMTPHPDCAGPETTILDAIKKMHKGKYLNLPVVQDNQVVGLIDVLKLTYYTLNTITTIQNEEENPADDGPIWKNFWGASFSDHTSRPGSANSGAYDYQQEVYPHESVSNVAEDQGGRDELVEARSVDFKLKTSGKVYRFASSDMSYQDLLTTVTDKLVEESLVRRDFVPKLGYVDDEDDVVRIKGQEDLTASLGLARECGWNRVLLLVTNLEERGHSNIVKSPTQINKCDSRPLESIRSPRIPDRLVVPAALGGGFLLAAIGVIVISKLSK